MNLPNKLTVSRIILVPFFMVFMLVPFSFGGYGDIVCRIIAAALFIIAAYTDHLDGKIARKYNLITDFGKFLDPLADKMMVLGGMLGLTVLAAADASPEGSVYMRVTAALCFVVLFRELAVTSLRLAASGSKGVVIAANMLGKIKTVSQIVYVVVALLEPVVFVRLLGSVPAFLFAGQHHILSYFLMAVVAVTTVWSGVNYFKAYFPLIDPKK